MMQEVRDWYEMAAMDLGGGISLLSQAAGDYLLPLSAICRKGG